MYSVFFSIGFFKVNGFIIYLNIYNLNERIYVIMDMYIIIIILFFMYK